MLSPRGEIQTTMIRRAVQRLALALRIILGSASFAGVLTTLTLARASSAQSSEAPAFSESGDSLEALPLELSSDQDVREVPGEIDPEQPPETNLETSLPLNVLLTPFRWGRFSLLSVTAYEGYSTNSRIEQIPVGAFVTSISTLALYSAEFAGWRMSLQYQPFFWISSTRTLKDFAAASADLRTSQRLNRTWHWTGAERFRYSPTHSTEQGTGFVANPGGGFGIGNIFLSSGRDVLSNVIAGTLTDHYNQHSTLTIHANQDLTRLSSFGGPQSDSLRAQEAITFSTGVSWRTRVRPQDTFILESVYRFQTSFGASAADVSSQNASIGWNHKLYPSLGVSASIGPAWSIYSGRHGVRTTLHGSLALSKEFRGGAVVLSANRSDNFSGVISDRFNNRLDLAVRREFGPRWSCSASASYTEQQLSNERATKGKLASASVHYFLSRNWAVFAQVRYLDIAGSGHVLAPSKTATVGLRWAWVPEKP